ncbi:MAG: 1-deoxy-D-xylulose-5-phosphate reductoisomerase [Acidobacteria bacterium]|nr:1-deoxy-D-xylulose-5-phosphate reductoisomerase [Acidobacteriota bacterium]
MSQISRTLAILGSTGSIGRSTLEVVGRRAGDFHVAGLAAGRNVEELAGQIARYGPRLVSVATPERRDTLLRLLRARGFDPRVLDILVGQAGAEAVAMLPEADIVVSAMVGFAGLRPTCAAVNGGKTVALANKETLVAAGGLVMAASAASGARVLPVDSEHNAIFQCLAGQDPRTVERLWLTASGGPFLHTPEEAFAGISVEEALSHPTWKMGRKITVDSATLMNKGLEVIEAHWLFGMPPERIRVVVHPQSVIHSMVEFRDGSFLAQLGITDMKLPIRFALDYPERSDTDLPRLNPFTLPALEFQEPDTRKFPCLTLACHALEAGGTAAAHLNAANEVAVSAFLDEVIPFTAIPEVIRQCLDRLPPGPADTLEAVEDADRRARETARTLIQEGIA